LHVEVEILADPGEKVGLILTVTVVDKISGLASWWCDSLTGASKKNECGVDGERGEH
jgi:hypothetical protein